MAIVSGCRRHLHHIVATSKAPELARRALDLDGAVGPILDRRATLLHERARCARREEGRDPCAACTQPLSEGALRSELHLQLARQVEPLEGFVFADV